MQPRRIRGRGECEGCGSSGADIDVAVAGGDVGVDGQRRVTAAVALRTVVDVVTRPSMINVADENV